MLTADIDSTLPNPPSVSEQDTPHCSICQFEEFDFDSFVETTFHAVHPTLQEHRPMDYSAWHAMAAAGYHYVFPGANANNVDRFLPLFECAHVAHLRCLLNSFILTLV